MGDFAAFVFGGVSTFVILLILASVLDYPTARKVCFEAVIKNIELNACKDVELP